MADIASTYSMSTTPAVRHTVTYEEKRSGSTVSYRFKVSTAPLAPSEYFGYDLICSVALNGKVVASRVTLKNASPSSWSSALVKYLPSSTGWYTVSGVTFAAALPAKVEFSSSQTSGSASSGNRTVDVPAGSPPTSPTLVLSADSTLAGSPIKAGVSGGAWGDSGAVKFNFQYSTDKSRWTTFYTGSAKSQSFLPSSYGGKAGSIFYFRVQTVNARGLSVYTKTLSLTVLSPPVVETAKMRVKVNGVWAQGIPYVKTNGAWKKAKKICAKQNGAWKDGV